MRRILFVFLDGIGLGPPGQDNPLSSQEPSPFAPLSRGHQWTRDLPEQTTSRYVVRHLDATLQVDGLPQSGTGQATLFSGINCAELVGRHFGPFPHSATYEVLDEKNLFHRVQSLNSFPGSTAFANAFPPQYFEAVPRRWTVTTRCCEGAGVPLRDMKALQADEAIPADLTAQAWRDILDLNVDLQTEEESADDLVAVHRDHRLTLFEYFLTDKLGHDRLDRRPATVLKALERFLTALEDRIDPETETLVVTSDHGNVEDLSHTQHTRNPVPLFVRGWAAPFFSNARSLADVTPCIVSALRNANDEQ